jgi:hypothetical protein
MLPSCKILLSDDPSLLMAAMASGWPNRETRPNGIFKSLRSRGTGSVPGQSSSEHSAPISNGGDINKD